MIQPGESNPDLSRPHGKALSRHPDQLAALDALSQRESRLRAGGQAMDAAKRAGGDCVVAYRAAGS